MSTKLSAEEAGNGVLLSNFRSFDDALTLYRYFARNGRDARIAELPSSNSILVLLPKITLEGLASVIPRSVFPPDGF